jgi:hypothetical protein
MSELIVESNVAEPGPFSFSTASADLLALCSFGYAEPLGSQHPLAEFIRQVRTVDAVDVAPLTTFYERDAIDPADAVNLEAAWQDPAPLAVAAAATRAALADDPAHAGLRADFPNLTTLLDELTAMASWAEAHTAQIRLSFRLR